MRKRNIALRVLLSLFLSAAFQLSAIFIAARFHLLRWLVAFEVPGLLPGVLLSRLIPQQPCGGWFCGLGQTVLMIGLVDWLFWAAVIFIFYSLVTRHRAAQLPPKDDPL